MGGKRKAGPRTPGVTYSDVAWQVDVAPLPEPKNRKEEISVGLIEVLVATWRDAGLKATYEISDTVTRGLRLRVQPRGPTYFCRVQYQGAEHRVRIGRIDAWGLAHARTACAAIVRHISTGNGVPSDEWIELQRQALVAADARKKGKTDAALPHVPEIMPRQAVATTWTYAEARTAYVDWLKAEMAEGHLAPATVKNYGKVLVCPAVLPFDPKHVAHLGASDLAEAVEGLVKEGKRNQANDVSRNLKRLFRWLAEPAQERRSGVRAGVMDRVRAPKIKGTKGRQHFPPLEECGLILATARASGVLNPAVGAAVHLSVWTAQRRLSIVTAQVAEFEAWDGEPGWGLWRCRHRKTPRAKATGKPHVLPLPPACWQVVSAYLAWHRLEYGDSTPWAFPQQRQAKAGSPPALTHIATDTLSHTLKAIPGSESSPHDMRRGLSSAVQDRAGVHAALVGHVLDHADTDEGVRQANGMTRRYTEAEMLGFKRPVMEAWARLLEPVASAAVLLPRDELKEELVRRRAEQRGVDRDAEKVRLKVVNAKRYAAGMTPKQRARAARAA
ncbi:hypothetical protein [Methylobacterium sp. WCS2018Hpa-22]|uniref:hypothetical protein n=1 Tax=Methylobacterium sp. WCS2018Hpa-22 TaxID=3073633 RepID=UPI00288AD9C9|nr:hypothetical protein [Methylobacterium sp. WCS2018Hpa-22]